MTSSPARPVLHGSATSLPDVSLRVLRDFDQVWMNSMIDLADTAIGRAPKEAGFGYVNMADSNVGHEQCTAQPAMNSLVGPLNDTQPESYHPNA